MSLISCFLACVPVPTRHSYTKRTWICCRVPDVYLSVLPVSLSLSLARHVSARYRCKQAKEQQQQRQKSMEQRGRGQSKSNQSAKRVKGRIACDLHCYPLFAHPSTVVQLWDHAALLREAERERKMPEGHVRQRKRAAALAVAWQSLLSLSLSLSATCYASNVMPLCWTTASRQKITDKSDPDSLMQQSSGYSSMLHQ